MTVPVNTRFKTAEIAFCLKQATVGPQTSRFEGAQVWVLPNPSGRNAHYSYAEMVKAFRALRSAALPKSGRR